MRAGSQPGRPTVVSLFTGAGGLDLGLEMAGFHTVAAVDNDADCVKTLQLNQAKLVPIPGAPDHHFLDGTKIVHAPVEEVRAADLRPGDCAKNWVPDLLAGGPPCQPFSSAGKQQGLDDPRGRLFDEFVRLANGLRPRLILFENVRGLITADGPTGDPGEALTLVRDSFERIGYATTFALLNAADHGAPQRRVRLFMIGSRISPLPSFPEPTHCDPRGDTLVPPFQAWRTLQDFLRSQPDPDPEEVVRPTQTLADQLEEVAPGSGLKSAGARETTRPGGHWGYKQGTFIADLTKPARTVTAASTQDWVRSREGLRRLTLSECAGLQGFPKAWKFHGSKGSRFRQVGNAVPTTFGRVLGVELVRVLRGPFQNRRPASTPWPQSFVAAVEYTKRDRKKNGRSRIAAKVGVAYGRGPVLQFKGLGNAGKPRSGTKSAA